MIILRVRRCELLRTRVRYPAPPTAIDRRRETTLRARHKKDACSVGVVLTRFGVRIRRGWREEGEAVSGGGGFSCCHRSLGSGRDRRHRHREEPTCERHWIESVAIAANDVSVEPTATTASTLRGPAPVIVPTAPPKQPSGRLDHQAKSGSSRSVGPQKEEVPRNQSFRMGSRGSVLIHAHIR